MSDWLIQTTRNDALDHQIDYMLRRMNDLERQVQTLTAQLQQATAGAINAAANAPPRDPPMAGTVGDVISTGRPGGQQVAGGTAPGEQLSLQGSSSLADRGVIQSSAVTHIWQAGSALGNLAEVARLTSVGFLGIGHNAPACILHLKTIPTGSNYAIWETYQSAAGTSGTWAFRRARGTDTAPIIVSNADYLGGLRWQGHDGTKWVDGAGLYGLASASPAVALNVMPTDLVFFTNAGSTVITERMRIAASGSVGIGTAAPTQLMHIVANTSANMMIDTYSTGGRPGIYLDMARGTATSPAAAQSADNLGGITWRGHDGTAFRQAAVLFAQAAGAPTATGVPSLLSLNTADSAGNPIEVMRWTSNRRVGVAASTPGAMLHINAIGTATVGILMAGVSGQTADLQQWQTSAAAQLFRVNYASVPLIKVNAAPADADLAAGEMALWLDATVGATKLMVKAKDSGGTVRTGTLALV